MMVNGGRNIGSLYRRGRMSSEFWNDKPYVPDPKNEGISDLSLDKLRKILNPANIPAHLHGEVDDLFPNLFKDEGEK